MNECFFLFFKWKNHPFDGAQQCGNSIWFLFLRCRCLLSSATTGTDDVRNGAGRADAHPNGTLLTFNWKLSKRNRDRHMCCCCCWVGTCAHTQTHSCEHWTVSTHEMFVLHMLFLGHFYCIYTEHGQTVLRAIFSSVYKTNARYLFIISGESWKRVEEQMPSV